MHIHRLEACATLVPLGSVPSEILNGVRSRLQQITGLEVKIEDLKAIPERAFNFYRKQYLASALIHCLEISASSPDYFAIGIPRSLAAGSHAAKQTCPKGYPAASCRVVYILGIISRDIYTAGLESVFGEASFARGIAVISTARLQDSEAVEREALHETGHLIGLEHCTNFECAMEQSTACSSVIDPSPQSSPRRGEEKSESSHSSPRGGEGKGELYRPSTQGGEGKGEGEADLCADCRKKLNENLKEQRKLLRSKPDIRIIYSDGYYADIGRHVFPVEKYRILYKVLLETSWCRKDYFIEPEAASKEELLLVHAKEYLNDLEKLRLSERTHRSELPLTKEIIKAYTLAAGGTILACREALKNGLALNLGGGFHHAFPAHAEGFCYINDAAVAVRSLQKNELIKKALIVDCDLHQGNGTAKIFQNDDTVFTFSIHQENLYPVKEKSDLDVGLPDYADGKFYLAKMRKIVPSLLEFFKPDLVVYLAGADPYKEDQLGNLQLSIGDLKERDELVLSRCYQSGTPVAVVLAGGYAVNTADTVKIHENTCYTAWQLYGR